jgi:hypothetical protein
MSLSRLIVVNVLVFLGLLLIAFVPLELYYRGRERTAEQHRVGGMGFWGARYPDTEDGSVFSLIPGRYRHVQTEFDYEFAINSFGYKAPNFDPGRPVDVAIFGDSFAFGHGVEPNERFSALVARQTPGVNIANVSYNAGFTAPHYLLYFTNMEWLKPRRVLIFTFLGNDCQADMAETTIVASDRGGYPRRQVVDRHLVGDRLEYPVFFRWLSPHSAAVRHVLARIYASAWGEWLFNREARPQRRNSIEFDSGRDADACRENLEYVRRVGQLCRQRNASCRLTNFLVPQRFLVHPNRRRYSTRLDREQRARAFESVGLMRAVMANCIHVGVDCVDLVPTLRQWPRPTYHELDAHWNTDGHRAVAELLLSEVHQDEAARHETVRPLFQSAARVANEVRASTFTMKSANRSEPRWFQWPSYGIQ